MEYERGFYEDHDENSKTLTKIVFEKTEIPVEGESSAEMTR